MDDRTEVRMSGSTTSEIATAHLKRISWGAVFAGAVVTIVSWMTLALLGMAVGLSVIDPAETGAIPGRSLGIGAMVWWIISSLIALFLGGWVAGRLAGPQRRLDGALHGVATWGVSALASVFMLTSAVGGIVGGPLGVVANVVNVDAADVWMARHQLMGALQGDDAAYGRDGHGTRDMAEGRRSTGTGETGMGYDRRDRDQDRDGGIGISGGIGADRSGGGAGISGRVGDVGGSAGVGVDRRGVTGTVRGSDDDESTRMSGTVGPGGVTGQRTTTGTDVDRTGTGGTMADANRRGTQGVGTTTDPHRTGTVGTGTTGMGTGTAGTTDDARRYDARDRDDDEAMAGFATREERLAEGAAEAASTAALWGFIMLLFGVGVAYWGGALGSPRDVTVVAASTPATTTTYHTP